MNVDYAKFQKKSLIVEQFQGNYLKLVKEQSSISCNSVTCSDIISDKIPHTLGEVLSDVMSRDARDVLSTI